MSDAADIDMTEVIMLAAALDLKNLDVAKKAAVAVKDAAQTTRDHARDNAPVDTGNLRDSLKMGGGKLTRRVVAAVPYSLYVEFGTSKMAPQPFLYPASDRGEEQLINDLAQIASEEL